MKREKILEIAQNKRIEFKVACPWVCDEEIKLPYDDDVVDFANAIIEAHEAEKEFLPRPGSSAHVLRLSLWDSLVNKGRTRIKCCPECEPKAWEAERFQGGQSWANTCPLCNEKWI